MIGIMATESVLKIICDKSGSVKYNSLLEIIPHMKEKDDLDRVLQNSDCFAVMTLNGCKNVIISTNLKLCKSRECQNRCEDLHLCKFYILGECNRRYCNYGHSLESEHNSRVLKGRNLHSLSKEQLCVLLVHSDNSLLPHVCVSYNKGSGEYGNCPDKESCNRLHVCESYIRGTCDGSAECSRAHDFYEPHPMKTLQAKGVPSHLMGSLYFIYRNILALKYHGSARGETASKSKDDPRFNKKGKVPERSADNMICLSYVKGRCKFEDKCWRVHFDMPYKWQVEVDKEWTDLPDNETIERDYCDPTKIHSVGVEPVCYDTMTQGHHRVRRLTTESSVVEPTFDLTTKWTWFWEDEYGTWIKYGSVREMHRLSSVNSKDLEEKYIHFLKENNNAVFKFTAGKQCYEINFSDMKQRNQLTGMERTVRRRPAFVSSANVHIIRTTRKRGAHQGSSKGVPGFWDKTAIPDSGFQRVLLSPSDKDYIRVQEHFKKSMKNNIVSIERVQNKELWEDFQTKRERMKKANKDKKYGEGERLLFHGTKSSHIDAICLQNFDMRVSGANGTVYGQGSYFARDAKYSHSYTDKHSEKCMFACRVLVGQYTKGESHYRRPPARDAAGTLYDSCVNEVRDPTIYVVFERPQVYPEFLIKYKDDTCTGAFGGYILGHSTTSGIIPTSNPTSNLVFQDVRPKHVASDANMSKTASTITASSPHTVPTVGSTSVSTGQVLHSPNKITVSNPPIVFDSTLNSTKHLTSGQRKSDDISANVIHPKMFHDSTSYAQCSSTGSPAKSAQDPLTDAEVQIFSALNNPSLDTMKPSLSDSPVHSEGGKDQNTCSAHTPNSASMLAPLSSHKDLKNPVTDSSLNSMWIFDDFDMLTELGKNVSSSTVLSANNHSFSNSSETSFSPSVSFSNTQKGDCSSIRTIPKAGGYRKSSPSQQTKKTDCVLQ